MTNKEFIDKKKGQVDFAIKVIAGNIRGRKLVLYGKNDEIIKTLQLYNIREYIEVTGIKENVKDGVGYLFDLAKQSDKYYILVPWLERRQEHVERLESLGFKEYQDFYFIKGSQRLVNTIMLRNIVPKDTINILTSCDSNLVRYIPIQLQGICEAMPGRRVRYYILHSRDSVAEINKMKDVVRAFEDVEFHPILMPDEKVYEQIIHMCDPNGWWPKEAFYDICPHKYLPADVDRVLYLDAGDVMVTGNIDAFYFADFHDMPIRATLGRYREVNQQGKIVPYEADDLYQDNSAVAQEIMMGVFNSGAFMINLKKMRKIGYSEEDYISFIQKIHEFHDNKVTFKFVDQGLLSAFFVSKIQYYGLDEFNDFWFRPFNHCLYYYNNPAAEPYYSPSIIHFAGSKSYKPWLVDFDFITDGYRGRKAKYREGLIKPQMRPYYNKWLSYLIKSKLRIDEQKYLIEMISVMKKNKENMYEWLLKSYVSILTREFNIPFETKYDMAYNYVSFPVSDDGMLHYEFFWDFGSLRICLHFENEWKKHENVIREVQEKCAGLKHAVIRDGLGIYYVVENFHNINSVVCLMKYLMEITYPILRKHGMVSDTVLLKQYAECDWLGDGFTI